MKKIDLAYYAGFFDGEGTITLHGRRRKGRNHFLFVQLSSTNEWSVQQLKFAFGGSIYAVKVKGNRKPLWTWTIECRQALTFIEAIYPYLKLKKPQADIAIKFQKSKQPRGRYSTKEYIDFETELKIAITKLNQRGLKTDLMREEG